MAGNLPAPENVTRWFNDNFMLIIPDGVCTLWFDYNVAAVVHIHFIGRICISLIIVHHYRHGNKASIAVLIMIWHTQKYTHKVAVGPE